MRDDSQDDTSHTAASTVAPASSVARPLAPVILVTGKGGVGKTTIAASLALLAAEKKGSAIFVEFGDGQSGKRALLGSRHRVEHVVITPEEALHRGATPLFGSSIVAKLAMGNFAMKPLLRAAPAVRELAMLESVRQLAAERPGTRIVVDLPATGHSVAWLRVPRQGKALLGSGPLFELCERLAKDLLVPEKSSLVVVTLPEALVLEETLELCDAIERDVGMQVDRIVINRVPVAVEQLALDDVRVAARSAGPHATAYTALLTVLEARAAATNNALAALAAIHHRADLLWRIPLSPVDPKASDVAGWLRSAGAT